MIKVVWSKRATRELETILDYWHKRNKSYTYPNKILMASNDAIELIKIHSGVGIETNHRDVRMRLVLNRFYIVYRQNEDVIEILKFWDCRQNPSTNPYLE